MNQQLDVYRDWLGIKETARPLNHYQLLRIKQFEDDPAKIRQHYRKLNAHVKKYASGDFAQQSQDLLNELAKAMLCLTDTQRKAEYDAGLGRKDEGRGRKYTFEQILIGRKMIDADQLKKARDYADAIGLEVRDAIVQQKFATQDVVMQAYAESLGLPYIEIDDELLDENVLKKVPAVLARQHSCAPVMMDEGQLLLASPNTLPPEVEDELRLRIGLPVRNVLCTVASINRVINEHYPREAAAAELAAGSDKASLAAKKKSKSSGEEGEAKPELSREEIAERKKQQRQMAFVGFNFTMMLVFGGTQIMGLGLTTGLIYALPAALGVATIVWMVKK